MADRNFKPCAKVGCPNLTKTPKRYCEAHENLEVSIRREQHKNYNLNRNDTIEQEFYRSKQWKKLREYRLVLDNHICQHCLERKVITKATTVHHIIDVKTNWDLRFHVDNLVSVCTSCHNKIHR